MQDATKKEENNLSGMRNQDNNFESPESFEFTFVLRKPSESGANRNLASFNGSTLASSTTVDSSPNAGRRYILYNTCLSSKNEKDY